VSKEDDGIPDEEYRKLFKDEGRIGPKREVRVGIDHGNPDSEPIYVISQAEYREWQKLRGRYYGLAYKGWHLWVLVAASIIVQAMVMASYDDLKLQFGMDAWWLAIVRIAVIFADWWMVYQIALLVRRRYW